MARIVKIEDVVEAMHIPSDWHAYLDPETGEIVVVTDEDKFMLEDEELDLDDIADWQRDSLEKIRAVLDGGRALPLPDSFDIHEWNLMRQFTNAVDDLEQRAELLDAIHGPGAFRLFRITSDRFGLRKEWSAFRDEAIRRIARDWLVANEIPFEEGGPAPK